MSLEIAIVFYSDPITRRAQITQICQYHKIFHCGIMLSNKDRSLVVAADKTHRAKFIPSELYHEKCMKPSDVIILGDTDMENMEKLMNFISVPYIGDTVSMAFWYYIGRWLFKSYVPQSCSILASQMARFCGFKVKDHVLPKDLLNHLKETYNHLTWREYKCR